MTSAKDAIGTACMAPSDGVDHAAPYPSARTGCACGTLECAASIAVPLLLNLRRPIRLRRVVEPGPTLLGIGPTALRGIDPIRLFENCFCFELKAIVDFRSHERATAPDALGVNMG